MTDHEQSNYEIEAPSVDINEIRRKLGMHVSENVQDKGIGPKPGKNHGQAQDLNNLTRNPNKDT